MATVNVYIISISKPDEPGGISPQAKRLYDLFASPLFQTTILKLDSPSKNIKTNYPGFNNEASNELYRFILALKDGINTNNKEPVLYITDTSVTDADASTVEAIVTSLITNNWDVCYLSKWLDSCDLYTDKKQINKNGTVLVNAVNPQGIQALMIRPDRFLLDANTGEISLKNGNKIAFENDLSSTLQKLIVSKQINAATVTPNLFNVDPMTITKSEDYIKLNECRDPSALIPLDNETQSSSQQKYITWGLLVIAILLLLYLLFR